LGCIVIVQAVLRATSQFSDPAFWGVAAKSIALTIVTLIGLGAAVIWGIGWLLPDQINLPWIGTVTWVESAISWAAVPLIAVLSVFLMVPVASAVTGLFLEDVADAVEARHFPHLPPATPLGIAQTMRDSLGFLAVMAGANLLALVLYLIFLPFAPLIFWGLNGFLLGREYFQLVAARRVGLKEAKKLRRKHPLRIWLAGGVMAVVLSVPMLNLLVPILGAATFTHLFHTLQSRA
jgi:uncharacterized protein involved in cysteine biosynthesis